MRDYNETMQILEDFYKERVEYWNNQKSKFSKLNAIQNILNLKYDPFVPYKAELDRFGITDFIDMKMKELGHS